MFSSLGGFWEGGYYKCIDSVMMYLTHIAWSLDFYFYKKCAIYTYSKILAPKILKKHEVEENAKNICKK